MDECVIPVERSEIRLGVSYAMPNHPGSECRTPCQIQWTRAFAKMTAIEDSHLQLRQHADMRRDASAQRGQGIATFEAGYDPALRMARRDFNQAFCHPGVIGFPQLQVRQGILSMRIKTG